ncbi:hypothetical protein CEXT_345021 [Caerostris extrusa]|uniref:Uncharacterized protein n=1 Tax=Caerostris extrusa TaxID=172846 RepID=A0AAV4PB41_CAEEX|nr:hypothetical protein CEXT_345021 [Caerostris extrusa]
MDLLRCEMCNCTITNFVNHRCLYREHSFDRIVSDILDYNFGNISQEIPATISHSAEGADYNSLPFTNRTSTFQSSIFPQTINQERHWDVNNTAGTNVRYASSNTVQNENFDYLNSSQGLTFPAAQTFENSDCTSGAEIPAMAFITEADTNELNPVEQPCTYNSAWQQQNPDLSFYNKLPPNCPAPSNVLAIYESTHKNYNISMNVESRQSGMPNFKVPRFQEYDPVAIARKSDRREENTNFVSYLNCTSINAKYHQTENEYNHAPVLHHASTRGNEREITLRLFKYSEFRLS